MRTHNIELVGEVNVVDKMKECKARESSFTYKNVDFEEIAKASRK